MNRVLTAQTRDPVVVARHLEIGKVAPHHPDPVGAGLGPSPGDHRGAGFDAVHGYPGTGQRDRQPAGTQRQLEHRPTGGSGGQGRDGRAGVEAGTVDLVIHRRAWVWP